QVKHVSPRRGHRRRRALAVLTTLAFLVVIGGAAAAVSGYDPFGASQVGQNVNGAILLPSNQWVSPLGHRILVRNARLVSSTLSPDGSKVAALSWNDFTGFLSIIDPKTGTIV